MRQEQTAKIAMYIEYVLRLPYRHDVCDPVDNYGR